MTPDSAVRKQCRRQQVGVDPAQARSKELVCFEELHHLGMAGRNREGQFLQIVQYLRSAMQIAARDLAQDKGMHQHQSVHKLLREFRVPAPEVIHPDRGIDERHPRLCARFSADGALSAPGFEVWLRATESSEPPGRFAGNQCFEPGSDKRRFLFNAGQLSRFFDQLIVQVKCTSHMHEYAS